MKIEKVKLTQVRTNAENPRTISKPKFQKLMDSILALPAMLEIRPVVVDHRMSALGGNMRLNALKEIAKMTVEQLAIRLHRLPEYQERGDAERQKLVEFWGEWVEAPCVYIINAKHLTEHERKQFMIKDNVSFGTWDYDALANKWPAERLEAWGLDIWTGKPAEFAPAAGQPPESFLIGDDGDPGPEGKSDPLAGLEQALPPELQGCDLTPDPLANIHGDDVTPSEHVVITYGPDERQALAGYLGVDAEKLYSKICWRIDELQEMMDEAKTDEQEDRENEND